MTQEELQNKIQEAKDNGLYYALTAFPTMSQYKAIVGQSLSKIYQSKQIDVIGSREAIFSLFKSFWLDDFNYLGTRIKILFDPIFEQINETNSVIPGMNGEKYKYLIVCDDKVILYAEAVI